MPPRAVQGRLDLSGWSFDTQGQVPLAGEWEMIRGRIHDPFLAPPTTGAAAYGVLPGVWNGQILDGKKSDGRGCATYRLDIDLPMHTESLTLAPPRVFTAYRLWVDGRLAAESGSVGCTEDTARPSFATRTATVRPHGRRMRIVFQVSNYVHAKGGLRQAIVLGSTEAMMSIRNRRIITEAALAGCLLVMAIYHLSLFFFRRQDRFNLYFSLICLLFMMRSALSGKTIGAMLWPDLSWALAVKMEWMAVYVGPYLAVAFFQSQFPAEGSPRLVRAGLGLGGMLVILVMATAPMVFTSLFPWLMPLVIAPLVYCLIILGRAVRRKRHGTLSYGIAFSVVFLATVNDILNASEVISTGFFLSYGLLFFVLALSIQLSTRTSVALRDSENQANALEAANRAYQSEISRRQRAQAAVKAYQEKLEDLVADRTRELETANRQLASELEDRRKAEQEREKLRRQLQRAQKMEAVGTLAGGVAHDLNNILSGLIGYPELLLMELPEGSPLRKPIEIMMRSGQKAATIVQDLLTLARRGIHDLTPVDLNDVTREYLESPEFQKLIEFHPKVTVETDLTGGLLPVMGSAVHLSKMVMNLVSNAAEAMPEGGRILIRSGNTFLDRPLAGYEITHPGDYVFFEISDTGVGMAPEELERVFEPFYSKKKLGRSGTGLGMAVVWGTVKDHRGYINASSVPNGGTTFTMYFPVSREALAKKPPPAALDAYAGHGESVLVVDDLPEQRELAATMLAKLGYRPRCVSSGEGAEKALREQSVDVVLLDMIMDPGIDGLETYRRIIHMHPGQKAVIASGYAETERVKAARQLGVGAYIRKPYTLETIGKAIHQVLDG